MTPAWIQEPEAIQISREDLKEWPAWVVVEASFLVEDTRAFAEHFSTQGPKLCPVCAGWKAGTHPVLAYCPVGTAAMVLADKFAGGRVWAQVDWTGVKEHP